MQLERLQSLSPLKPITKEPLIASQADIIYLGTNLLLKSSLLIRGETESIKTAQECTKKAIELVKILNRYDIKYLTVDEVAKVRREFEINLKSDF